MPPTALCVVYTFPDYMNCVKSIIIKQSTKQTNIKTATFMKRLDIKYIYLDLQKQSYRTPSFRGNLNICNKSCKT